jgi:hypothetical protein
MELGMELTVSNPDEVIAAVSHVIGFQVESSVVVLPLSPGLPASRVDLPLNQAERDLVVERMMLAYGRAGEGQVMLVGFAENQTVVDSATRQLREAFEGAGIDVHSRLLASEHRWKELDTGVSGPRTGETARRIDAEMVSRGRRMPASSRAALGEALVGDPDPVARYLPGVADDMARSTPARERQWAISRAEASAADGHSLTDPEAARMLACLQSKTVRDQMSDRISVDSADSWAPLWDDLTRRAPDELVAPPATLSALTSWSQGDGARAWAALERIPTDQRRSYPLAGLVASALQIGLDAREWDRARTGHLDSQREPAAPAASGAVRSSQPEPPSVNDARTANGPAR